MVASPSQEDTALPTVAHCATPYPYAGAAWIYHQITYLKRYRPIVLAQESSHQDQFPLEILYSAQDYPPVRRLANRLLRRLTGQYPFYAAILRRQGARLIHAHFGHQGCRCLRAKRACKLPMVTTFYGYDATRDVHSPHWRPAYLRLFEQGEAFLAEGGAMKGRLVEAGCPADKVHIQHLGVDLTAVPFAERQPANPVRFLICAPFREKKGIPYALEAVGAALKRRDFPCQVVLIGDGPDRPQVLQAIDRAGLQGRVDMRGMQPYEKVLQAVGECHIFLQTSITARDGDGEGGAPFMLLDAQASGLPVVATRHADIPEVVVDGESGLLADERDIEGLADRILHLVENPGLWAQMGRGGRRHVEENYNAQIQGGKLEEIYDALR
ncbi:MAG: glycosyltransferase [Candidatus Latescibacteria bacterium]|nr:glycosyltransferase [Candidatus Latescibacterota bacterium]